MERLLITGVDRALGGNLALALADRYEVLGVYEERAVSTGALCTTACEMSHQGAVRHLIDEWRPRAIIHCGPLSASSWDGPADLECAAHEPRVAAHLAQLAGEFEARLTVFSSDVVFAGPRMYHEEDWPAANPAPRAAQVREMERAVEAAGALVLRTHAYGWSPAAQATDFAERDYEQLAAGRERLAAGRTLALDGLRHATPILATDLAELVVRADERRLTGLYHLAGAERTSPWGFAAALAAVMGRPQPTADERSAAVLDAAVLEGGVLEEAGATGETSLNSKRLRRQLAMPTPMLREGLERFVAQAEDGWRERWQTGGRWRNAHELAA